MVRINSVTKNLKGLSKKDLQVNLKHFIKKVNGERDIFFTVGENEGILKFLHNDVTELKLRKIGAREYSSRAVNTTKKDVLKKLGISDKDEVLTITNVIRKRNEQNEVFFTMGNREGVYRMFPDESAVAKFRKKGENGYPEIISKNSDGIFSYNKKGQPNRDLVEATTLLSLYC